MELLKQAIEKAKSEKNIEQLAVEYGISSQSIYRVLSGKEPSQPRVRAAIDKLIKDFT